MCDSISSYLYSFFSYNLLYKKKGMNHPSHLQVNWLLEVKLVYSKSSWSNYCMIKILSDGRVYSACTCLFIHFANYCSVFTVFQSKCARFSLILWHSGKIYTKVMAWSIYSHCLKKYINDNKLQIYIYSRYF